MTEPATSWTIVGPEPGHAPVCEPILRALPDWFGIEEAIVHYVGEIDRLPTFRAVGGSGTTLGFISVKRHSAYAAELYVLGVRHALHRQGIGSAMLAAAEAWLRAQGVEYLQVKTLSPAHPDPNYARTRLFYEAAGFRPLEEMPELWGEANPCLIMVKHL
ncbi:MAG TPA: GNAT family N-acetyltransferase [Anaerolineae bacterium]|nr:GNAT family N-acetyltransferase [Anaerolineae bacterium]